MDADSYKISRVFNNGGYVQYILPYFQREYAWDKNNWKTLLDDVFDLYEPYTDENPPEHFMGSLVVINHGVKRGMIPVYMVVDGQQRLTTISLMFAALASLVKDSHQDLYNKIRLMVTNLNESEQLFYKLLPTKKYGDLDIYTSIIAEDHQFVGSASRIAPAYQFFYEQFQEKLSGGQYDPEKLFHIIINSLQVVFISLNQNERPYEIFESLNAKGKPLSQADLVRNFIAMKLPENRQEPIFESYWMKIENLLQEKRIVGRSNLGELTAFIRHYLAFRTGTLCNEEHVYARFRDRINTEFLAPLAFENEIATLKQFAEYYDKFLRPENENDATIRDRLERLNSLEFSTGYPFLLASYDAYSQHRLERDEFLKGLEYLENYLVRRYIAAEPTNYLNKAFPSLWKDIDLQSFSESLAKQLVQRNYPNDYRVSQSILTRRMYDNSSTTRNKTILILQSINRHIALSKRMDGMGVLSGAATIEHIMPQTLTDEWKNELGLEFERVYEDYLHTLGNLTLVSSEWNSTMSNSSFIDKRGYLEKHILEFNRDYFSQNITCWDEQAIRNRAKYLTSTFLEIWPSLGETPTAPAAPYLVPTKLIIQDAEFFVHSWRDVAEKMAEFVITQTPDFEAVASGMPSYFGKQAFVQASRRLSNNWWLMVNLSANSTRLLCHNLIKAVGLTDNDWRVEVQNLIAPSSDTTLPPTSSTVGRKKWDEDLFLNAARESQSAQTVSMIEDLYQWSDENASQVTFGTGNENGSFTFHYIAPNGQNGSVFSVLTNGSITINFGYMEKIFTKETIEEFRQQLAGILSYEPTKNINQYYFTIGIESGFANPDSLEQFKNLVHNIKGMLKD